MISRNIFQVITKIDFTAFFQIQFFPIKDPFSYYTHSVITGEITRVDSSKITNLMLDPIQQFYKCCGPYDPVGYKMYKISYDSAVPQSCCIRPSENCGLGIFEETDCQINNKVW